MEINKRKLNFNWIYIGVTLLVGFSIIVVYLFTIEDNYTNALNNRVANFYIEESKKRVEREVETRLQEVDYELEELYQEELAFIKKEILHTYWLMKEVDIIHIKNGEEGKRVATQKFEELFSYSNEYMFFAISDKGVVLRAPFNEFIEGSNMLDARDDKGNHYIKEMLEAVNNEEGVVVQYYCCREQGEESSKKSMYCFYIPELNIIIGAGIYDEDLQEKHRKQVFDMLQAYYTEDENYIFVTGYDATCYVSGNPDFVGKKLEVETEDGISQHDIIMKALKENRSFVTYDYFKKNEMVVTEKISYVKAFDPWNAYIGMGFHVDDLNLAIEKFSAEFKRKFHTSVFFLSIVLLIIALLIFVLIQRGAYLQFNYIKQEEGVFMQLFQLSEEAIILLSSQGKLLYSNDVAHHMFATGIDKYLQNNQLAFEEVDENTFKIVNVDGRSYYTEMKRRKIHFNNQYCTVYFIKNITEQYIKSHKFEKMALIDVLTGLYNRRSLTNDFEQMYFNKGKQGQTVVAMIDLDDFKSINDIYGHNMGDNVIQMIGEVFNTRLRQSDKLYRYGGEEFVVILKSINLISAQEVLQFLNEKFDYAVFSRFNFHATFSGGVVVVDWKNKNSSLKEVLEKADNLLYQAKKKGRNRIEIQMDGAEEIE